MSMETYEALTAERAAEVPAEQPGGMRLLAEKEGVWAGMLADVLTQHHIPFVKESTLGAGLAIRTGALGERMRFFVPASCLPEAKELVDGLFAGEEAQ